MAKRLMLAPLKSRVGKSVPAYPVLERLPETEQVMRKVYRNLTGEAPDPALLEQETKRSDNVVTALAFLVVREYITQGLV